MKKEIAETLGVLLILGVMSTVGFTIGYKYAYAEIASEAKAKAQADAMVDKIQKQVKAALDEFEKLDDGS